MATISLTTILSDFTIAEYDDVTGDITLNVATGLTSDEAIINSLLTKIEASASGKRTNLDMFVSEQSTPPTASITTRRNADNTASEVQIEKKLDISLWYVQPDLTTLTPINESD